MKKNIFCGIAFILFILLMIWTCSKTSKNIVRANTAPVASENRTIRVSFQQVGTGQPRIYIKYLGSLRDKNTLLHIDVCVYSSLNGITPSGETHYINDYVTVDPVNGIADILLIPNGKVLTLEQAGRNVVFLKYIAIYTENYRININYNSLSNPLTLVEIFPVDSYNYYENKVSIDIINENSCVSSGSCLTDAGTYTLNPTFTGNQDIIVNAPNGSGYTQVIFQKSDFLDSSNIKKGVTIYGITGEYIGEYTEADVKNSYNNGYQKGIQEGEKNVGGIENILTTLLSSFFATLFTFLNFEIIGIKLYWLFVIPALIGLILLIWKIIRGN